MVIPETFSCPEGTHPRYLSTHMGTRIKRTDNDPQIRIIPWRSDGKLENDFEKLDQAVLEYMNCCLDSIPRIVASVSFATFSRSAVLRMLDGP